MKKLNKNNKLKYNILLMINQVNKFKYFLIKFLEELMSNDNFLENEGGNGVLQKFIYP